MFYFPGSEDKSKNDHQFGRPWADSGETLRPRIYARQCSKVRVCVWWWWWVGGGRKIDDCFLWCYSAGQSKETTCDHKILFIIFQWSPRSPLFLTASRICCSFCFCCGSLHSYASMPCESLGSARSDPVVVTTAAAKLCGVAAAAARCHTCWPNARRHVLSHRFGGRPRLPRRQGKLATSEAGPRRAARKNNPPP